MKRTIFFALLCFSLLALAVPSAMALGPAQAGEVGNNPNIPEGSPAGEAAIENPGGIRIGFSLSGNINLYQDAEKTDGLMNNIALEIDTAAELMYLATHRSEFYNTWVYLSGESTDGKWASVKAPSEGAHSAVYWLYRSSGFTAEEALTLSMEHPQGLYLHNIHPGQ